MIKCEVCGCTIVPKIENHYVARDPEKTGVAETLCHNEGKCYDAFDCPACGCQIITQERKRVAFLDEEEDYDE